MLFWLNILVFQFFVGEQSQARRYLYKRIIKKEQNNSRNVLDSELTNSMELSSPYEAASRSTTQ
jgi:hypothetical protein